MLNHTSIIINEMTSFNFSNVNSMTSIERQQEQHSQIHLRNPTVIRVSK